ncbi:hypothetical protein ACFCZV_24565 [Streptomyces hydrogenans]|uniref:hypothetical protein n=1 Tax=Streptomyces hydrogenans TaxID=1873719 RepID=UPI0035E0F098
MRLVTLNMTVAELETRFSYAKSTWTPLRNGSRNISADLIDTLLDELIPEPEMRERLREEGHRLLLDAVEAEKLRVAGAPLPAARARAAVPVDVARLDDARLQYLEAAHKQDGLEKLCARLMGMVSVLQDQNVQLRADHERAMEKAEARADTETERLRVALERAEALRRRAEDQLELARRAAKNSYRLRRVAEEKVSQALAAARHAAEAEPPAALPAPKEVMDSLLLTFDKMGDALDDSAAEIAERTQGVAELEDDLDAPPAGTGTVPSLVPPSGAEDPLPADGPGDRPVLSPWNTVIIHPAATTVPVPAPAEDDVEIIDDVLDDVPSADDADVIEDAEIVEVVDYTVPRFGSPARPAGSAPADRAGLADGGTGTTSAPGAASGPAVNNTNNANNAMTSENAGKAAASGGLVEALSTVTLMPQLGGLIEALRRRAGEEAWSRMSMAKAATWQASDANAELVHQWTQGTETPTQDQLERLVMAMGATEKERKAFRAAHKRVIAPNFPAEYSGSFDLGSWTMALLWTILACLQQALGLALFLLELGLTLWSGATINALFGADTDLRPWKILLVVLVNFAVAIAAGMLASAVTGIDSWFALTFITWVPTLILALLMGDLGVLGIDGRATAVFLHLI